MSSLLRFLRGVAPRPNAAPELRITLARRLVETQGAPFVPTGETFTEVASVLDEIGLLPAAQGPTVVRVRIEGGTAAERASLAGDWLVDPDGGDRVLRLPKPEWGYDEASRAWASMRTWLEAWETCPNAAWMLRAAGLADLDRNLLVLAACACVRTVLPFVPAGEERPLHAIEAAERWTRAEAPLEEVRSAAEAAWDARAGLRLASAASAAARAAYAAGYIIVYDEPDFTAGRAARAADAASASASASAANAVEDWAAAMARLADLVRGTIPTLAVLRAVATLV